mgnify:FL=1
MDDTLVSAIGSQAAQIEQRLFRLHGAPKTTISLVKRGIFYGHQFRARTYANGRCSGF